MKPRRVSTARTIASPRSSVPLEGTPTASGLDQNSLVFERTGGGEVRAGVFELWHPELQVFRLHLEPGTTRTNRFVAMFSRRGE